MALLLIVLNFMLFYLTFFDNKSFLSFYQNLLSILPVSWINMNYTIYQSYVKEPLKFFAPSNPPRRSNTFGIQSKKAKKTQNFDKNHCFRILKYTFSSFSMMMVDVNVDGQRRPLHFCRSTAACAFHHFLYLLHLFWE